MHLQKRKDWNNIRSISLLSIAHKISARVHVNRLAPLGPAALPENHLPPWRWSLRPTTGREIPWPECWPHWVTDSVHLYDSSRMACKLRRKKDDSLSKPFSVTEGVKQGCVLAFSHEGIGVNLRYRTGRPAIHPLTFSSYNNGVRNNVCYAPAPQISYLEPVLAAD